ncbi:MAG: transcription antitermination factor NusB [Deltaproteobacteria bacterium]|nr:transcription antitermination factor NusB [Deltaproteobacteria bacterium]
MSGLRRQAREMALQMLYMLDIVGEEDLRAQLHLFWENYGKLAGSRPFAMELTQGVRQHLEEIDQAISRSSHNWKLNRMSYVDRNLLRLAVYELLYRPDIPPKVSINEAIEISKRFGDRDSGAFINGILDQVFRRLKQAAS